MKITRSYLKKIIKESIEATVRQEAVAVSTNAKVVKVEEKGRDLDFTIQIGRQSMTISFSLDGGSPLVGGELDYYDMTQPEQDAVWDALRANPKYAKFKADQDAEAMEKYFGKKKSDPVHESRRRR